MTTRGPRRASHHSTLNTGQGHAGLCAADRGRSARVASCVWGAPRGSGRGDLECWMGTRFGSVGQGAWEALRDRLLSREGGGGGGGGSGLVQDGSGGGTWIFFDSRSAFRFMPSTCHPRQPSSACEHLHSQPPTAAARRRAWMGDWRRPSSAACSGHLSGWRRRPRSLARANALSMPCRAAVE